MRPASISTNLADNLTVACITLIPPEVFFAGSYPDIKVYTYVTLL